MLKFKINHEQYYKVHKEELKNMETHPGVAKLDSITQISLCEKETHNA